MRVHVFAGFVAIGLAILCACRKEYDAKPGGRCPGQWWVERKGVCADKSTFLFCDMKMTFTPIACRGPKGCSGSEPGAFMDRCDFSGNTAGEACPTLGTIMGDRTERVCAAAGSAMTVCSGEEKSTIEVLPCRGPKGCGMSPKGLACDDSIAEAGDKCDPVVHQALYTCSTDHKTMLACRGTALAGFKWEPARSCRGEKACVRGDGPNVSCDSTIADVGDPCEKDDITACSADKTRWLICKGKKYTLSKDCKKGCSYAWTTPGVFTVTCTD
jgi:hypothetical protein